MSNKMEEELKKIIIKAYSKGVLIGFTVGFTTSILILFLLYNTLDL